MLGLWISGCQASKTAFRSHCARPYGTLQVHTGRYIRDVCERGDLSEFLAARTCASCWLDKSSGHLLLFGDGLRLGFWVRVME